MSDIAITVDGLGKRYRISHQTAAYGRLTESFADLLRSPVDRVRGVSRESSEWIWALRDVSFELKQGDVVGVLGRNGAGKSTLLKVLSRITAPTVGTAILRGRVASLLEVGTGFHPELTGRENIYLSGAVLGMRRSEISRKFDEIVDFSGVEQFLDTPVKRYSSGMQVRLGFAVAAHLDPDILFVDEVLAVGDLAFQEKCLGKMSEVAGLGRTVVFVSHSMGAIGTMCPTTLWLDQGRVRMAGATTDVIPAYVRAMAGDGTTGEVEIEARQASEVQVTRVRIVDPTGELMPVGECSTPVIIEMTLEVRSRLPGLYAYLEIQQTQGTTVLVSDSLDTIPNPLDNLSVGRHVVTARIPPRTLGPGRYNVYVSLASMSGKAFNVDLPGVVGSFRLHDPSTSRGDSRGGFFSTLLEWDADPETQRTG